MASWGFLDAGKCWNTREKREKREISSCTARPPAHPRIGRPRVCTRGGCGFLVRFSQRGMVPSRPAPRKMAAGTVTRNSKVCLRCPVFSGHRRPKCMEAAMKVEWRRSASGLISRLCTDRHNARILGNPWSRAAHSMVQGWRIRLSRPPAKGNSRVTARPTWRVFARLASGIAATKANHARRSDWHLWATRRVTAGSRYIPKGKRQW